MANTKVSASGLALALGLTFAVATYAGWQMFWFLTDDAYIAFRYVGNLVEGRGLVWNPPPFLPVEGYTSFLWVILLAAMWEWFGVLPPDSANWMSLAFGYGTLLLGVHLLRKVDLPESLEPHRTPLIVVFLLGTVTNRTFLTWLSSGLETSLFNFLLTAWVVFALGPSSRFSNRRMLGLAAVTSLVALARPDGLLFTVATVGVFVLLVFDAKLASPLTVWGLLPLGAIGVHLLWRHEVYGMWLPNTYYAKYSQWWPESGLRYFGSFVLEYGLWAFLLLCLASISWLTSPGLRTAEGMRKALVVSAVIAHVAYYTLVIGGDHFEYRVYSYLVPLLWCATIWMGGRFFREPIALYGALVFQLLVSWPIQWVHWQETHQVEGRRRTHRLFRPIAPRFPSWVRPPVSAWDQWQAWLIGRLVAVRHQEHKDFWRHTVRTLPDRAKGSEVPWDEKFPITSRLSVGIVGWVVPNIAIVDHLGLNDRVIARNPVPADKPRRMAHDRRPPRGYIRCFRSNVRYKAKTKTFVVRPRREPFTAEDIRACETRQWPGVDVPPLD